MSEASRRLVVISDFNTEPIVNLLNVHRESHGVHAEGAAFGQVIQSLVDPSHECWQHDPHGAVVWTTPEGVLPSFQNAASMMEVDERQLLREVDDFGAALVAAASRLSFLFVPTWGRRLGSRGYGLLDMRNGLGLANWLARINLHLVDLLQDQTNIFVLDAHRWAAACAGAAQDSKMWYLAKMPFGMSLLEEAAADIIAAVRALYGGVRKLVVVDLDDTLWGGIVGDVGWEALRLGGHDAIGEAYVDFQLALNELTNRGVLLAIVSKNEESIALEAIRRHPEMVLSEQDFSGWRINWEDKAQNVCELVSELNIGLEAVVFIDDNPMERARVRDTLPEVLVPEWPEERMAYATTLRSLRCFDVSALSDEDRSRTQMYVAERARRTIRRDVPSIDAWLGEIQMEVSLAPLESADVPRAVQLLNKTNQMNLSTRRMAEAEFVDWLRGSGRHAWTVRVRDRFADSGLTGLVSIESDGDVVRIVDFVLSCRVMGRRIEERMVSNAVEFAREAGLAVVEANVIESERNAPCVRFWTKRSGFEKCGETNRFTWTTKRPYPA